MKSDKRMACASKRAAGSILFAMLLLAVPAARAQYNDANPPAVPVPVLQSAFNGSLPAKQAMPGVLQLSLSDAVARGLKQNLGLLLSSQGVTTARGERWKELSNLLPNVSGSVSEHLVQENLVALGFKISIPGVPTVVGPFGYVDARAYVTQSLVDLKSLYNVRAAGEYRKAAEYSYQDAHELVVLATGSTYLQALSSAARIETVQAQVKTAQTLYDQASDQLKAGTSPSIDALRAQVELQTQQQRFIAARNQFEKDKLALARVIGLPPGQKFELTSRAAFTPLENLTPEEALQRAYNSRADYRSMMAGVRAAEMARKAAVSAYYPTISLDADYGDIGVNFANSHGTVDAAATLRIPIFQGGKTHGDVLEAEATLEQARAQMENLRGQIDQDVRAALLDMNSSYEQVKVSQSNVELAARTLQQASDRFAAGVTDNIEVVQAQQSVASANESYISSLYLYNLAKLSLARAVGYAQQGVEQFLKGQ
jgi:outer membrane protein TolC